MIRASGKRRLDATVDDAWKVLVELERYPEWLTFHQEWVGEAPVRAAAGLAFTEKMAVFGAPAVVDWEVTAVDDRELLELAGKTAIGMDARFVYRLVDEADGTTLTMDVELSEGPVVGPVAEMIQQAAQELVTSSVEKFPAGT